MMSRTSGITGRMTETIAPQRIDGFVYSTVVTYRA